MSGKKCFISILLFILTASASAQQNILPPSGLMTDLVSETGQRYLNGYPITVSEDIGMANNLQTTLVLNQMPSFSWELQVDRNGLMQTAYQVLMADDAKKLAGNIGNVWDSGKKLGSRSTGIAYGGLRLKPNTRYFWKVRFWDGQNIASDYSLVKQFWTGEILSDYKPPAYPLSITEQKPSSLKVLKKIYRADFGKDAFSQLRLQLYSSSGNDTIKVRLGEVLDQTGNIDRKPPGKIRYAQYILVLLKGLHTYKININKDPYNTRAVAIKMPDYIGEVTPFRYCEIENYKFPLQVDALTRLAVNYRFDEEKTFFQSSDSTLNAVWDLCKYSIKATSFLGIYVDGDRERIPYEADAYINQLSHYAVDKEFTMARNSHEYLLAHPTWPTEWNLQSVLMAWNDYLYTGDLRSAAQYYRDLQAKTLIKLTDSTGLISTLNGKLTDEVKKALHLIDGKLKDIVDWPLATETDGFVFTKYNAVVNAFHYRTLVIMEKIAADLGKVDDAAFYRQRAVSFKTVFQRMFFDRKRGIFRDGVDTDHASLQANAFALALGLVDDRNRASVLGFIKSRGMACSVYGSQFLLDGVYDANDGEYGLSLLTSKTDRSWYNMIRAGSTMTMEAWDNKYKPNQDWNHAWGAAPANIISRKLMGIEPIEPGWSTFRIKPQLGSLKHAKITAPTIKGDIKATYEQGDDFFTADIEIPGNTTAQIYLPMKIGKSYEVWLDNQRLKTTRLANTISVGQFKAGHYLLKVVYN